MQQTNATHTHTHEKDEKSLFPFGCVVAMRLVDWRCEIMMMLIALLNNYRKLSYETEFLCHWMCCGIPCKSIRRNPENSLNECLRKIIIVTELPCFQYLCVCNSAGCGNTRLKMYTVNYIGKSRPSSKPFAFLCCIQIFQLFSGWFSTWLKASI